MMDIEIIENAIQQKIEADITDIKIDAFPDEVSKYPITQNKGAILVRFNDAGFGPPQTPVCIAQKPKLQFLVTVSLRKLRGHQGVYGYIKKILKSLTGWKVPVENVTGKMYPVQASFIEYEANIWTYGILFEFPMVFFENQ